MKASDRPAGPIPPQLGGARTSIVPHRRQGDHVDPDDAAPDPEEDLRCKLVALARTLARQMARTDHKAMAARVAAMRAPRERSERPKAKTPDA